MEKGVKKIIEIFKEKEFKVLIKNNKIPFVSGVSDFEILQASPSVEQLKMQNTTKKSNIKKTRKQVS